MLTAENQAVAQMHEVWKRRLVSRFCLESGISETWIRRWYKGETKDTGIRRLADILQFSERVLRSSC